MNFRQMNTDNSQMNCGTTKTIDKKTKHGETLLKGRKGSIFISFIILFFSSTLHVTWIAANIKSTATYPLEGIIYCPHTLQTCCLPYVRRKHQITADTVCVGCNIGTLIGSLDSPKADDI